VRHPPSGASKPWTTAESHVEEEGSEEGSAGGLRRCGTQSSARLVRLPPQLRRNPSFRSPFWPHFVINEASDFEPALVRRYPVSTRVNQVQNNDGPDCAKPLREQIHRFGLVSFDSGIAHPAVQLAGSEALKPTGRHHNSVRQTERTATSKFTVDAEPGSE
jgi:hypothetical protein